MRDLLSSVRGSEPGQRQETGASYDVEAGFGEATDEQGQDMAEFFRRVEAIRTDLKDIKQRQQDIQNMHERSKTIVHRKEMQKSREEMQFAISEVSKLAKEVKVKIDTLDKLNNEAQQKKGQGVGTASERTRTSITAGLKKKLKDHMGEFSSLRTRIHDEYREVVERRVYTVTGQHVDEEKIDKLIEAGEAETIFQKAILEQGRGRVLDTVAEIEERHKAVKDIEQSLLELHQMFLDMAVLVEAQGEMLDNIEKQVARANDYVKAGAVALQDAKQYQKKTRKWMCCGIILLLIIAVIIVLVIIRPWNMNKSN